ncbi:MAG: RIP metalloprotease RseP, partial [Candidatus Omnitrophica bacterium]|nr:RIP metalloprotease RseP [Candidatus Omnitrophota bacterium]
MNSLMSILPALIVFGVLIIVHEFGHFIACRLSKVRVEKFSIVFGPELVHWQSGETRFSISLLPLGGFVSPAGEEASKVGPEGPKPGDFLAASVLSRMFIVISGVVMNYVLAFVVFWAVFMIGRPMPGTVVGGFVKGYPAEASLLKTNDKILKVNDKAVANWQDILAQFDEAPGSTITLDVERSHPGEQPEFLSVQISPKVEDVRDLFGKNVRMKRVGITPDPASFVSERYGPLPALAKAWELETFHTVLTHKALFYLLTGQLSPKNLMGPLGIIQISGQAAKAGIATLLQLLAILSVSLAVINLFPLPALDGGHLVFLLIELVTRRRISAVWQERITTVGFYLLMALMVFVIYNDFINLQILNKIRGIL